jgi:hypothetical protein
LSDDELRVRVKGLLGRIPAPPPDLRSVARRARRLRGRRVALTSVAAVAVAAAVAVPLAVLGTLGTGSGRRVAAGGSVPDVARVVCDASGTRVLSSQVAVQADGLHLQVENRTPGRLAVRVGSGELATAVVVSPGLRDVVLSSIPPGTASVSCQGPARTGPSVSLRVLDPGRLYVPTVLSCPAGAVTASAIDHPAGARGAGGDPVDLARAHFGSLRPGDVVERAGYPEQTEPEVRVVREGRTVAVATFRPDGRGGWLLTGVERCSESDLTG